MFSWPFLFQPLHKDGGQSGLNQTHEREHRDPNSDYYDSSDSFSSDESDSRFMSVRETSFIALHSHHRVQQLENVVNRQKGRSGTGTESSVAATPLPTTIQPKGHDDVSQISFDYGSSTASLDTSVGLNPYHDNTGRLSHFDIGLRWKKHTDTLPKALLESSSGSSSVPIKVAPEGNQENDTFARIYDKKKIIDHTNIEKMDNNSRPSSRSRMTIGMVDGERDESLENSQSQNGLLANKVKKKYSDSQFQISPVGTTRKTAAPNMLLTGDKDKSQFSSSNGRKENKRNVRLVLGSGRETSVFNILHDDDNVLLPKSDTYGIDEHSEDFKRSFVEWPSEAVHFPVSNLQPKIDDGHHTQDSTADISFKKGRPKSPELGAKTNPLINQSSSSEHHYWQDTNDDMIKGKSSELNCTMPMSDDDEDSLDIIMNEGEEQQCETPPGNCDKSDSSVSSLVYSTSTSSVSIPNRNHSETSLNRPINLYRNAAVFEGRHNVRRNLNGTPDGNITDYDVTRLKIRKAAELNCILLSLFDNQDRNYAAQTIQKNYRGFRDRHFVMQMIGVAKRKRWEKRTKSLSVTKIHSNFRRLARRRLRFKCETYNDSPYVGCMAVEILHVCSNVIQTYWNYYRIRLRTRRLKGYGPTALASHCINESKAHNVPAFVIDEDRVSRSYDCQRPHSATSATTKITSTTISLSSDHFEKDYYSRPNAYLHEDDECLDELCNVKNDNFEASVSLLTKLHKGIIGRIVKIFRRVPRRRKSKRKSSRSNKRFRFFRKDKASQASPRPMLGDPEVNAELPDPLSLYYPLAEEEQMPHDSTTSSTSTHGAFNECASQLFVNEDLDAFSLVAGSIDHFLLQEELMNFDCSSSDGEGISFDDRSCASDTSTNESAEESVPWDEV